MMYYVMVEYMLNNKYYLKINKTKNVTKYIQQYFF